MPCLHKARLNLRMLTAWSLRSRIIVPTDATIPGTFELISTDWTGVGTAATGSLLVTGDLDGVTITINGQALLGGDGTTAAGQFDTAGGTNALQAAALATAINADTQTGGENVGSGIEVTAFQSLNAVLLTATDLGTAANTVLTVTDGSSANVDIITATLNGGTATGAVIMQSERVKVTTQTQSEAAPATAYTDAGKIALGASGVNVILTTATDPLEIEDIDLYFHLDGVNVKATEEITTLDAMVNGDTITIDGVVFTAESTLLNVDGNEFFTVEGTAADDAITLDAAINAASNVQFTSTVSGDVVTVQAKKGGTEGNSITLAQNGDGVTLGDTTLNNGDNAFSSSYSGAISATFTFGTACDI